MEQLPRVGYFSGEKPTPKGEIDFNPSAAAPCPLLPTVKH